MKTGKNRNPIPINSRKSKKNPEPELCARFQTGDFLAFNQLSAAYSNTLKTVAEKYDNQGLSNEELIIHAKIGLMKAAHRYDESKMVSFRLYAIWWMRQVILKALQEQAKIEQIPELLISNLHEIMRSFVPVKKVHDFSNDQIEISEVLKQNIQLLIRSRNFRK